MPGLKRWILPFVSITLGATIATYVVILSTPLPQEAAAPEATAVGPIPVSADIVIDVPSPPLASQVAPPDDDLLSDPPVEEPDDPPANPTEPPSVPKEFQPLLAPVLPAAPPTAATQVAQPVPAPPAAQPAPQPTPAPAAEALPEQNRIGISSVAGEGDDQLRVYIKDEDIRVVLAALSEQGSLNILPSKNVQGTVSAALNGVTVADGAGSHPAIDRLRGPPRRARSSTWARRWTSRP